MGFCSGHLHYLLRLREQELLQTGGTQWIPVGHALSEIRVYVVAPQLPAARRSISSDLVDQGQLTLKGRALADEFVAVVALAQGVRGLLVKRS